MVEDCERLNMMQSKGDSSVHLLSLTGKENFSKIKKLCGCSMGERCSHATSIPEKVEDGKR